jgi:ketosteroid isomerase-like protein
MADATDPVATVRNYIDAFNRGDAKAMAAAFALQSSILDGMAPHLWVGPTASQDWYRDVLAEGEQHGASDYRVTLDKPRHANVTGDAAYVVVPATMTFNLQGKQVTQTGAVFTVALRKAEEGWRIAAWAWAKGAQAATRDQGKTANYHVKFTQPGQTHIGISRGFDTLDGAVDYAIGLERDKNTIEGIDGPDDEAYDRVAYAELTRKKLAKQK